MCVLICSIPGTNRLTQQADWRGHWGPHTCKPPPTNVQRTLLIYSNGKKLKKISKKCFIWIFQFWHFPSILVLLELTCLVTLFDRKLQVFKNSPNWVFYGIFNQLLSTQNVNVARFARNVEWDFFAKIQIVLLIHYSKIPYFVQKLI